MKWMWAIGTVGTSRLFTFLVSNLQALGELLEKKQT
jgi:hypothetical protein